MNDWQVLPNDILRQEDNENKATAWAARQRAILADKWAAQQRQKLEAYAGQFIEPEPVPPESPAVGEYGQQLTEHVPTSGNEPVYGPSPDAYQVRQPTNPLPGGIEGTQDYNPVPTTAEPLRSLGETLSAASREAPGILPMTAKLTALQGELQANPELENDPAFKERVKAEVSNAALQNVMAMTTPVGKGKMPLGEKGPMAEAQPNLWESAVAEVNRLTKEARPVNKVQQRLYSIERGKRFAAAGEVTTPGEAGAKMQLASLRGELPKVEFTPVREGLSQEQVDSMFTHINDWAKAQTEAGRSSRFVNKEGGLRATAQTGLFKLLDPQGTTVPQLSELKILKEIFGKEFVDGIIHQRSLGGKIWDNFVAVLNLPRALLASFDVSATLRQGALLSAGHPIIAAKNFIPQIRAMFSEKYAQQVMDGIKADPHFGIAEDSKLAILGWSGLGPKEEAFISKFAEAIPSVKQSERAYVTFLNKLRWDVYKQRIMQWEKAGTTIDPETGLQLAVGKTMQDYEKMADAINILSGRGNLGRLNENGIATAAFFSPRYVASRFQAPLLLLSKNSEVRKEVARDFAAFIGTNVGLLAAAKASGVADVELDPLSSDFGKMRVGNVRLDTMAGYSQLVRFIVQMAKAQRKTTETKQVTPENRADVLWRFAQSKGAPIPGLTLDLLRGQDYLGNPLTLTGKTSWPPDPKTTEGQAWNRLAPLFLQDLVDAYATQGWEGAALAVPSGIGVGLSSYPPTPPKPGQLPDYIRTGGRSVAPDYIATGNKSGAPDYITTGGANKVPDYIRTGR